MKLFNALNTTRIICFHSKAPNTAAAAAEGPVAVASLYRRISPLGDPKVSVVPVLDQWVQEGRTVKKTQLVKLVKDLRRYRRFSQALEVSQWMSDKRYIPLSSGDIAVRLDLIGKVHGVEEAENHFNNIPIKLRTREVYIAFLNCYAQEKDLEKAENIMQQLRNLGFATDTLCYNIMLNLYCQTRNLKKLDALIDEMGDKGIKCDSFTLGIRLNAYAAAYDVNGMEKLVNEMESNCEMVLGWTAYAVAANGYMKAGFLDKALVMLKKCEGLVLSSSRQIAAYDNLLTQYAAAGEKDQVQRIWELYKKTQKMGNKGYLNMISSLLKFDDIEGAEKIFEEWETSNFSYDFRIPNLLVGFYCRKGIMDKAEALVQKARSDGGKPFTNTWCTLAAGYVGIHEISKAIEPMKVAIKECQQGWKVNRETLVVCLEYLESKGDIGEAEEFLDLLCAKSLVSASTRDKLLKCLKNGGLNKNVLNLIGEDSLVEEAEALEVVESKQPDGFIGVRL